MSLKRNADALAVITNPQAKKTRNELMGFTLKDKQLMEIGVNRTSNLFAPIMVLEGHKGDIFSAEFSPDGDHLISTGFDRQIFIWTVYGEQPENVGSLSGHTGAILEAHWSPCASHLYACSTDKLLSVFDVQTCTRIRKMRGHQNIVNSISGARRGVETLVTGSDDSTIKVWDARKKQVCHTLTSNYQVTAVCLNDTAEQVISGGIDNEIKVWDIRKNEIVFKLPGHTDTVTGVSLSPDGSYLLSNSMDNTLRIWDIRPYCPTDRCVKILTGHQHNFEKNLLRCAWSKDGNLVSCGSADRFVYIWDVASRRILYKLPGHNGSVNDVDFHPIEPIILSGSSDKQLYLGELEM